MENFTSHLVESNIHAQVRRMAKVFCKKIETAKLYAFLWTEVENLCSMKAGMPSCS